MVCDSTNDVLALELAAAGTQFEAPADSKAAFETLMDGDQWMIFKNTKTDVLHWDFSVIQRMLTFDTSDEQWVPLNSYIPCICADGGPNII